MNHPDQLVDAIAPLLHERRYVEAAAVVARCSEIEPPEEITPAVMLCSAILDWCLAHDKLQLAAKLLWPPSLFNPEPESVRTIWKEVKENQLTLLPGASSMGKTYTPGVLFFLEWLRDPEYTQIIAVGPSEEHLEGNLFSHLHKLHAEARLPVPGIAGKLFIGASRKNSRAGIKGQVIPLGRGKGAGKLQGAKRHPRPVPHPEFGPMSRLFIILDELENIPSGVFGDIDNLVSNVITEHDAGIKIVGCWNPKDVTKKPYTLSDPPKGWKRVVADEDFVWTSKCGWRVVRLDAYQCENVVQDRVVFLGLQTATGFAMLVKNSGGVGSSGYWTFGRGMYPPQGSEHSFIADRLFDGVIGTPIWTGRPAAVAGVDLALEGGDVCEYTNGLFGEASAIRLPPEAPGGPDRLFTFLNIHGSPRPRNILFLLGQVSLPRGDTVAVANEIRRLAGAFGVQPEHCMLDRTGNGAGVHDVLKLLWSPLVRAVNYSETPSGVRILEGDERTPEDTCFDISTELFTAFRAWLEHRYIWFSPDFGLDGSVFREQITGRLGHVEPKGKSRVESKRTYKSRGNPSPDKGDSGLLTLGGVRAHFNVSIEAAAGGATTSAPLPVHRLGDPRRNSMPTTDCTTDMSTLDLEYDPGQERQWPAGVGYAD